MVLEWRGKGWNECRASWFSRKEWRWGVMGFHTRRKYLCWKWRWEGTRGFVEAPISTGGMLLKPFSSSLWIHFISGGQLLIGHIPVDWMTDVGNKTELADEVEEAISCWTVVMLAAPFVSSYKHSVSTSVRIISDFEKNTDAFNWATDWNECLLNCFLLHILCISLLLYFFYS